MRFPDSVRSDNGPVLWALIPQHKMAQPSRIPDVSPEELAFENKPSVWDMAVSGLLVVVDRAFGSAGAREYRRSGGAAPLPRVSSSETRVGFVSYP